MQKGQQWKATSSSPAMMILQGKPQQAPHEPPSLQQRQDVFNPRESQFCKFPAQMPPNMAMVPDQMQQSQGHLPNQQPFFHGQGPMRMANHQGPLNPQMGPSGTPQSIHPGQSASFIYIPQQAEYFYNTQSGPPQMQYRPQQAMQGQFSASLSSPSQPPGPCGYIHRAVYPIRQPSPGPVYTIRAPAVTRTDRPQHQSQSVEPRTREKKIIQIKDPSNNRDVTQEILNSEPSGCLTDSTGGTPNSAIQDFSRQPGWSSAPLLTAQQQQAETSERTQFLTQGATLAVDNKEKPKNPVYYILQGASPPVQMPQGCQCMAMAMMPDQMQPSQRQFHLPNPQQFFPGQVPRGLWHQGPNNPLMCSSTPGGPVAVQMMGPSRVPRFIAERGSVPIILPGLALSQKSPVNETQLMNNSQQGTVQTIRTLTVENPSVDSIQEQESQGDSSSEQDEDSDQEDLSGPSVSEENETIGDYTARLPAASTSTVSGDIWMCHVCTFLNPMRRFACEMCSSPRESRQRVISQSTEEDEDSDEEDLSFLFLSEADIEDYTTHRSSELPSTGWPCRRCTFMNLSRILFCEICDAPREPRQQERGTSQSTGSGLSSMIDNLSSVLSSQRQTTISNSVQIATRSHDCVVETFLGHFGQESGPTASWPRVFFDDDGVGDGVTKEAFSLFWDAVVGRMFQTQGGDVALPILTPKYNSQLWKVVGRILAYTVAVLGEFPVTCVCQVLCLAIFNLEPNEEVLVKDFLSTLRERERDLLSPLFFNGEEQLGRFVEIRRNDLLEVLREFNVSSLPPTCDMRTLLVNVARYNLLEVPTAAITSMQAGFQSIAGSLFSEVTRDMVADWYLQQRRPVFEEISARLKLVSNGAGARRMFGILMGFLREHRNNEGLLRSFLRYSTGSPNVRGNRIKVDIERFYTTITHKTCLSTICLPIINDDRESEKAFLVQLKAELASSDEWTFNSA